MNAIHPTAHVAEGVVMGPNNVIGPGAVIGPGVTIGEGNRIHPHAILYGPLQLGDRNWIGPSAWIGTPGQQRGSEHGIGWAELNEDLAPVRIGSENVIREGATVQGAATGVTAMGDRNYVMTQVHIPHNALIGDDVTLAVGVALAGHTTIMDGTNLGLNSTVHQYLVIGPGVMLGMGSVVTRDIPPYAMAFGAPARVRGANRVRMQRLGLSEADVEGVAAALQGEDGYPDSLRDQERRFLAAVDDRRSENQH